MAAFSFTSLLRTSFLILTLLFIFLFFLLKSPSSSQIPRRSLLPTTFSSLKTYPTNGFFNYLSLHFCLFIQNQFLSVSSLSILSLVFFYILIKTTQSHFSIVTTKLSTLSNLSQRMAAVTLLALGNGSPDIFSSVVVLRTGQYRTGFGAIPSTGAFVSAFVFGFVSIYAAPFSVDAGSFVRDVGFYLISALFLFYVYLSEEIFVWQAVAFIGLYVFFVGMVFWMDLGMRKVEKKGEIETSFVGEDCEIGQRKGLEYIG